MNAIAWTLVAVYAVGLALGLVAACSAHRYRELRDIEQIKSAASRGVPRTYAECDNIHSERQEAWVGEVVYSFMWPLTIVMWFASQILAFLIDIASIPGERKAARDGIIKKEK